MHAPAQKELNVVKRFFGRWLFDKEQKDKREMAEIIMRTFSGETFR